jgi:hypothetical protein
MKSFARSLVWWPGIDKDLESLATHVKVVSKIAIKELVHHSYTLVAIHSVRNHVQVLKSCLFLSRFVSPYSILANFQFAQRETHRKGHLGVVKMKSFARSLVWWPGIDKDLESLANKCEGCQQNRNMPASSPFLYACGHPFSTKSCTSAKVLSFLVSICISLFDTGKFSICST